MDWKTALTNSLLAFFAATLVVLIAHSLDVNSASRMEGQLERVADELELLRKKLGGEVNDEKLIVYYLHSNDRCPTCRWIESTTDEIVHAEYADELESGRITWKVANYDKPAYEHLDNEFGLALPSVVLVRSLDRDVVEFESLPEARTYEGKDSEYSEFLCEKIDAMLEKVASANVALHAPLEDNDQSDESDADSPQIPASPVDLPIPMDELPIPLDDLPIPDGFLPIPNEGSSAE
jgi:hypothetical protein